MCAAYSVQTLSYFLSLCLFYMWTRKPKSPRGDNGVVCLHALALTLYLPTPSHIRVWVSGSSQKPLSWWQVPSAFPPSGILDPERCVFEMKNGSKKGTQERWLIEALAKQSAKKAPFTSRVIIDGGPQVASRSSVHLDALTLLVGCITSHS